jgi:nucleoside-diphosphate-sugar epimerase
MKILVTGSAGFVGRHMVAALEARGASVVSIDPREQGGEWRSFSRQDCRTFFRLWPGTYDLVVHCAATVGGREGIDHNAALLGANNVQLDGALFEWALRIRPGRILYLSSAAAYPVWRQNVVGYLSTEDDAGPGHLGMPDESYGWAKLTGELLALKARAAGVPVTVVRPFSMYDFDQDDDYPFPMFAQRAARRDNPFVVWGDGEQVRDWIHIDDAVAAMLALVDAKVDGPVNLGTGIGTSMDELAQIAMECAGYRAPIEHLHDKPMGVRYRVADSGLMREFYEPRISVREGMARAIEAVSIRQAA